MIDDFIHVAITCRDLDRSVRFYEALGLSVVRWMGEIQEPGIARAFRLAECRIKVAHLAPPGATSRMFIDLVQWVAPASDGGPPPALTHVGINRVAFRVSDIDATVASLRERGVTFLSDEPQSFGPGIRSILTTDPDGVFVQFVEGM